MQRVLKHILEETKSEGRGCQSFDRLVFCLIYGGVNSKEFCFGRKTKFFPESENFAKNQEESSGKQSDEVKISVSFVFFEHAS